MTNDCGSMESLLAGAGVTVAAAIVMLAVIALFRSTGPADSAIALQATAADICGDIGSVAASAVPCIRSVTCPQQGINVRVTSDYVVAAGPQGMEFARPLIVRVFPGNYRDTGGDGWNGTAGMREYFNATFGQPGTKESPLSTVNGSKATGLLEQSCRDMVARPVMADLSRPLTIEKLFMFIYNASTGTAEGEPYVFVY